MNRLTAIVFDLDGTLYCNAGLAEEIRQVAAAGLAAQLSVDSETAAAKLAATRGGQSSDGGEMTLSAACELLGGDIMALHRYLAAHVQPEKYLRCDQRVVTLLQDLVRHHRLYIYTNNNRPLTTRIMAAIGVETFFTEVFTVEDFWLPKPDRLALAKLFAAIGAEPGECLFVGDRYDVDLRLPEEHGCTVFLTTSLEQLLTLDPEQGRPRVA